MYKRQFQHSPLLLTRPDRLPAVTETQLNETSPEHMVIVGGTAAVAQSIQDQLNELVGGWMN